MENEETTLRDWNDEAKQVDEVSNKNWFKPEADQEYHIMFLDEGGPETSHEFEDRTITQIAFKVRVIDEQGQPSDFTWTITKGGKDSCYGKLVKIFQEAGKAKGTVAFVTAVGDGKSRRYLVKKPKTAPNTGTPAY